MIRTAVRGDIPALLMMAERFIHTAWSRIDVPYCEESCRALLESLIENEAGILLVATDHAGRVEGMIGALVYPWHFNRDVLTGQELFWWVEPGSRQGVALLEAAERAAADLGAETFNMACIDHLRGRALARLYAARGYQPSEHIFIRRL